MTFCNFPAYFFISIIGLTNLETKKDKAIIGATKLRLYRLLSQMFVLCVRLRFADSLEKVKLDASFNP
ncbi:hypothetical protein DC094_18295 [Pelagibaculum spongiae]|uniref:Uncharacterized protein n=1 Tax=Pelagibaculum spongiae TaxID=2080658 RepID=A0A2V1GTN6_9GAMM|nr:hypothetical protein DC094_18295 [Pelagibaculum spongiae]